MDADTVPPGRFPGKYFVIGFVIFAVVLFAGSYWLSRNLEPAADRFHNPTSAKKAD
ncbi:MAG: hypothetical protein U0791_01400 [Gemmataceae bacterium]